MSSLSARLEAVLALLAPCRVLVDVGTNHAHLPIAAVARGIATYAVAKDLRDAPLDLARRNIEAAGLSRHVGLLKGDGLRAFAQNSIDAVVIAGISGEQTARMCEASPHVLSGVSQLVLQPNTDAVAVRAWALQRGWHLHDERLLSERGRFFCVCAFRRGIGEDPAYALPGWTEDALCLVGPKLLSRKDALAHSFYASQSARLSVLVEQGVHTLRPEFEIWQAAHALTAGL